MYNYVNLCGQCQTLSGSGGNFLSREVVNNKLLILILLLSIVLFSCWNFAYNALYNSFTRNTVHVPLTGLFRGMDLSLK